MLTETILFIGNLCPWELNTDDERYSKQPREWNINRIVYSSTTGLLQPMKCVAMSFVAEIHLSMQ